MPKRKNEGAKPDAADLKALFAEIFEAFRLMTFEFGLADLHVLDEGGVEQARFDRLSIAGRIAPSGDDHLEFGLRYGHDGLDAPVFQEAPELAPRSAKLDLTIDEIPLKALVGAIADDVAMMSQDTGQASEPGAASAEDMAAADLLRAFQESPPDITVNAVELKTPTMAAAGQGTVEMRAGEGTVPAVGALDFEIKGLVPTFQAVVRRPNAQQNPIIAVLAMLQALGKPGGQDAANPDMTYHVELTKEGKTLVNGIDLAKMGQEEAQGQTAPDGQTAQGGPRLSSGAALQVRNVKHEMRSAGSDRVLVVTGEVANTGGAAGKVSRVRVALLDAAGKVVQQEVVPPSEETVPPGGSVAFGARLVNPPDTARRMDIEFEAGPRE